LLLSDSWGTLFSFKTNIFFIVEKIPCSRHFNAFFTFVDEWHFLASLLNILDDEKARKFSRLKQNLFYDLDWSGFLTRAFYVSLLDIPTKISTF